MGYSATACAVIGLKIDNNKLYTTKRVRGCGHDLGENKKAKFCPECGEPTWDEDRVPIVGYDPDDFDTDGGQVFAGYKLVMPNGESDDAFLAGLVLTDDEKGYGFADEVDFSHIKAHMKKTLLPLGLWDEKEFGLWAILIESY